MDVISSNGNFINGDRLSAEGVESEPFELKSEDQVVSISPCFLTQRDDRFDGETRLISIFSKQEFGIDIVSEDNKTVVHRKVAAKAYCVFNVDDAGMSARFVLGFLP